MTVQISKNLKKTSVRILPNGKTLEMRDDNKRTPAESFKEMAARRIHKI